MSRIIGFDVRALRKVSRKIRKPIFQEERKGSGSPGPMTQSYSPRKFSKLIRDATVPQTETSVLVEKT